MKDYDVIIIGGGIAGLTSAIYTTRAKLSTLVLEKNTCGGLANWAVEIENYPSYKKIGGMELMERVKDQAEGLGVEILEIEEVVGVEFLDNMKKVRSDDGEYQSKAVIVASGREPIELAVDTESENIHYCAICDASMYEGRNVLVVGGGNSGVGDALYLLNQGVDRITLVEQEDRLFASKKDQDQLCCRPNVDIMTCTEVTGLESKGEMDCVTLRNTRDGRTEEITVCGTFVYMGQVPKTEIFKDTLNMDEAGYIRADENMNTNIPGVFVAGDVRQKKYRQLTTAVSDGTIAALEADQYIRSLAEQ